VDLHAVPAQHQQSRSWFTSGWSMQVLTAMGTGPHYPEGAAISAPERCNDTGSQAPQQSYAKAAQMAALSAAAHVGEGTRSVLTDMLLSLRRSHRSLIPEMRSKLLPTRLRGYLRRSVYADDTQYSCPSAENSPHFWRGFIRLHLDDAIFSTSTVSPQFWPRGHILFYVLFP